MTLSGMWLRVFDCVFRAIGFLPVVVVCVWLLRQKRMGHRQGIIIEMLFTLSQVFTATSAAFDFYFNGHSTRVWTYTMSMLVVVVRGAYILAVKDHIRETLQTSETAEFVRISAQLDQASGQALNQLLDKQIFDRAEELLNRQREILRTTGNA